MCFVEMWNEYNRGYKIPRYVTNQNILEILIKNMKEMEKEQTKP